MAALVPNASQDALIQSAAALLCNVPYWIVGKSTHNE